ncbi:MAG: hypothetical protein U1E73_00850 [Planctomycetota bacterium]
MHRPTLAALLTSALWGSACLQAQTPAAVLAALTGVEHTAHFEVHYRPGSRAEAAVDRVLALVEDDLARILKEVGLERFDHVIRLYLYDDVAELQRLTGVPSGGHSTTLESHLPCDNDQTRVHELVHVVAEQFEEHGSEPRNLFFAEGLANAVLRFVSGVSVDAVAAFYHRRGRLPAMAEIQALDDFYSWLSQRPGFNGYDVAGSWMRYLLDRYGAERVRRYYKGVPPDQAFGENLAELEHGWHARLDQVKLRPGLEQLLAQRAAVTAAERNPTEAELTAAVRGPEEAWEPVAAGALGAGEPGRFTGTGKDATLQLDGKPNRGDWCVARLGPSLGDVMVRCTATPQGCFGVRLDLGQPCQALVLKGQGTFLYTEQGGISHDGKAQLGSDPVEIVLRRRGTRASIWIDGKLVADGDVAATAAPLGVGCVGGAARFTAIAVRRL